MFPLSADLHDTHINVHTHNHVLLSITTPIVPPLDQHSALSTTELPLGEHNTEAYLALCTV